MQETEMTFTVLSLLSAFIGLLAAIIGRKKVVEIRHVAVADSSTRHRSRHDESDRYDDRKWYDKTLWLVLWLILFWPVGIYGLFKSRAVGTGWKFGIASMWVVLIIVATAGQ